MKLSYRNTYKLACEEYEDDIASYIPASNLSEQVWQTQLQNRQILINGEINESLIEKAVIQVMNINDFDDEQEAARQHYERFPISILINTIGGNADEAFSLISTIKSSKTPVNTVALGKAWSAGFMILLAGHYRCAQRYSTLMLHQGAAGISDSFGKMIEYAKYWDACQKRVDKYILDHSKITKKQLDENYSHKQDWYLTADEALKLDVIDEII